MKHSYFLISIFFTSIFSFSMNSDSDCTNAHSKVSYVLSHAKRALSADNFDHQTYYAERAITALEKTQNFLKGCGCNKTEEPGYQAMENLKKASTPKDWDKGRFFTKKALVQIELLIAALDICTSGIPMTDNTGSELAQQENILLAKQKELETRQQTLKVEQEKLAKELKQQKQLTAVNAKKRQKELQQQEELQLKAESSLEAFEKSFLNLLKTLGCKDAHKMSTISYKRMLHVLKSEGLSDTKRYYAEKAKEITLKALEELSDCTVN